MAIRQTDQVPHMRRYFRRREPQTIVAFNDFDALQVAHVEESTAERFDVALPVTASGITAHISVIAGLTADGAPDVLVSGRVYLYGPAVVDGGAQARMELGKQVDGLRRIREALDASEAHLKTLEGEWHRAVLANDAESVARVTLTQRTTREAAKAYRRSLEWMGAEVGSAPPQRADE